MRTTTLVRRDRTWAWMLGLSALLSSLLAAAAGAQQQPVVPSGFEPPAGMCRIWINEVPASQQPAPTDCVTAVRNRPANARVIFGPDIPKSWKGKKGKIGRFQLPEIR